MIIQARKKEAYDLLHEGTKALAEIHENGFHIDREYYEEKIEEIDDTLAKLDSQLWAAKEGKLLKKKYRYKANFDSPEQLRWLLYEKQGHKVEKTTGKGKNASTDKDTLAKIATPWTKKLLEWRKLDTTKGSFLTPYIREEQDGMVHPFYNLALVDTYRSSAQNPNMQNVPKRDKVQQALVRAGLFPSWGNRFGESDIGGAEVKVGACYHEDPTMIKYILDPTTDMHRDMAMQIFKIDTVPKMARFFAKNKYVFASFYGSYYKQTAPALWDILIEVELDNGKTLKQHLASKGIITYDAFEKHMEKIDRDFWNRRFKVYKRWKDKWYNDYLKKGYFDTLTGFRCSGLLSKNQCVNYPVQGSAFHCLLWSLIQVHDWLKRTRMKTKIMGQVHDSIISDIYPRELDRYLNKAQNIMTTGIAAEWKWLIVPMEVEMEVAPVDEPWLNIAEMIQVNNKWEYKEAS